MKTKLYLAVLIVLVAVFVMSGCVKTDTPVFVPPTTQPTVQPTQTARVEIQIQEVVITATPEPIPTETPIKWTQIQVARFSESHEADGKLWELPLGTFFAVSTANGQYEAVESALVGVVNGTDYGWCGPTQLDCPPHAFMVLVEVPEKFVSCAKAEMDISWRINFTSTCDQSVPVRFSIRYNDQTRTLSELEADYLALAGLTQQPLDTLSEVGLFVSVRENGQNELTYEGKKVAFGYSCWNCLPDTKGPNDPIPYPLVDIETFGVQGAGPIGSSMIPGVVFPLPRPDGSVYVLSFEMNMVDSSVVWVGRYDTTPLSPTATP